MKKIVILDANSILRRAFHALPPLTTKKGELVNGVYGFLLLFFKLIRELQPDYIYACFDYPTPTFRHQKFKEYKIFRPPTPKDLISQIKILKEILKTFKVIVLEKEGFEAEDLIGTICQFFSEDEKIIVSGDSDLLQLVSEKTKVYFLKTGVKEKILYDEEKIKEEYQGLEPQQLIDLKALIGDPSDNIPGIEGIGKKTAQKLLKGYKNLKNLFEKIEKAKLQTKLKQKLINQKEKIFFNRSLVEIRKDVPIEFEKNEWEFKKLDEKEIIKILEKFEFKSLIKKFLELKKSDKNVKIKEQISLF